MALPAKNSKFIQNPFGIQRPYIADTYFIQGVSKPHTEFKVDTELIHHTEDIQGSYNECAKLV